MATSDPSAAAPTIRSSSGTLANLHRRLYRPSRTLTAVRIDTRRTTISGNAGTLRGATSPSSRIASARYAASHDADEVDRKQVSPTDVASEAEDRLGGAQSGSCRNRPRVRPGSARSTAKAVVCRNGELPMCPLATVDLLQVTTRRPTSDNHPRSIAPIDLGLAFRDGARRSPDAPRTKDTRANGLWLLVLLALHFRA